jgi:hypothetical protein
MGGGIAARAGDAAGARRGGGADVMQGFVYILTNEWMPDIVKIGRTARDVELRASELWQTGVPAPFDVFTKVSTPDCVGLEAKMHGALRKYRVAKNREFFRVPVYRLPNIARILRRLQREQIQDYLTQLDCDLDVVRIHALVKEEGIERLAIAAGVPAWLVAEAVSRLTVDEIMPAVERAKDAYLLDDPQYLADWWEWRPEREGEDQ